ncbi:MAG: response regulator transcription factor [Capsulimonas sp.]|uniref:response regulator transcription factor n=1 Tax=Capsulimonas sp. TaxID=2494211 RepID=UPI0032666C26
MTEDQMPDNLCAPSVDVLLVDDHAIWRGGVRSMLEGSEFRVVGEAGSGKEALEVALRTQPRLILLDIRMAGGDGLDALQTLKRELPGAAVIMLTTYDNPTYMARAVAGGAAGYLLKGIELDDLLLALRAVANGEMLLQPQDLIRALRDLNPDSTGASDLIEPLTRREEEVLRLIATGLPNRQIGSILFIAESTVKSHVEHIIGKLGVSDRVQAAVWAARHGVVDAA